MGYSTSNNGQIKNFWPDNTDDKIYILADSCYNLQELMDMCKEKFGQDISFDNLEVTTENIHTDCLGYDSHDSSDWTDFIVVRKIS